MEHSCRRAYTDPPPSLALCVKTSAPKAANIKPAIQDIFIHSPNLPVNHRVASNYYHQVQLILFISVLHISSSLFLGSCQTVQNIIQFILPHARLLLASEVGEGLLNNTKEILEDLPRRPQRNNGEASAR